jgi:hypothetical protein
MRTETQQSNHKNNEVRWKRSMTSTLADHTPTDDPRRAVSEFNDGDWPRGDPAEYFIEADNLEAGGGFSRLWSNPSRHGDAKPCAGLNRWRSSFPFAANPTSPVWPFVARAPSAPSAWPKRSPNRWSTAYAEA